MEELIGRLYQVAAEPDFSGVVSVFRGATSLYNRAFGFRVGFDSRHLPQEKLTINILSNVANGESKVRSVVLSVL